MTNGIYALFNRLSCRLEAVMSFPTPGFAVKAIKESYEKARLPLDDLTLKCIGTIDIETCAVVAQVPKDIPFADFLPMTQEMEKTE